MSSYPGVGLWLAQYLASCGVCARRKALILIQQGLVLVNNHSVSSPAYRIQPGDIVTYQGVILHPQQKVVIALNKPRHCVTTLYDPQGRVTVLKYLSSFKERLYPVGRLDYESTGLLLLTNDGFMAMQLSHPSYGVEKSYYLQLHRPIESRTIEAIKLGVVLEDGLCRVDSVTLCNKTKNGLIVTIHSGRNRILRRLFTHLGYEVLVLDRRSYGPIDKGALAPGQWRYLTEREMQALSAGQAPPKKRDEQRRG
jgi:23S rRNA pseudouridine2605 synthase